MTHRDLREEIARRLDILSLQDRYDLLVTLTNTIIDHMDGDGDITESVDCLNEILDDLENHGIDPYTVKRQSSEA